MLRFFPLRSARRMSFVLSSLIALAGCAGSTGLTDPSLKDELLPVAPAADTGQCVAQIWDGRDGVVRPKWLRIVCPEARTPAFDLDLRRALAARGHGEDLPTAIAGYQSAHGLPSDLLAYRTAQQLGLVPWIDEGI